MAIPEGYFALLSKDKKSGSVVVRFPDHPNIVTYGHDFLHAKEMAGEALSSTLEVAFERGFTLPAMKTTKPKPGEKVIFVRMTPEVYAAYLLREWRASSGLTQKQLAAKLGIAYQSYQRMERPGRANLTLETLQKIAKALNKELVLDLRESHQKTGTDY